MIPFTFATATALILKASLVLAIAALVHAAIGRRSSAAARHLVWSGAIAGLLTLPVLTVALPEWSIPVPMMVDGRRSTPPHEPSAAAHALDAVTTSAASGSLSGLSAIPAIERGQAAAALPDGKPSGPRSAWATLAVGIYLGGVALLLLRMVAERVVLRRLTYRAEHVKDARWTFLLTELRTALGITQRVSLLRSRGPVMPLTWGTRRPAILIPDAASQWTDDRRQAVLLHELAHVARRDCLLQMMASVACALYWFHPGVWHAARRLRVERELACDDRVLAAGSRAQAYARHLLELAHTLRAPRLATAMPMARTSHVEMRIRAVLDDRRNRRVPGSRVRRIGTVATALLLVPLAAASTASADVGEGVQRVLHTAAAEEQSPAIERHPDEDETLIGAEPASSGFGQELVIDSPLPSRAWASARQEARTVAQDTLDGAWTATVQTDARLRLTLQMNASSWGSSRDLAEFSGLAATDVRSAASTPVAFRLDREAGRFDFTGVFQDGVGGGHFRFYPNAAFGQTLRSLGIGRGEPTDRQLMNLALANVSVAQIREFTTLGLGTLTLDNLVEMAIHGVTPDYVRTLRSLRVPDTDRPSRLVEMRIHGVTPEFVRELQALGFQHLAASGLVEMRIHRVTPALIRELQSLGYEQLDRSKLVEMRIHGASPSYIRELRAVGLERPSPGELVEMRIHGVSAEFIRELQRGGMQDLSPRELVEMRIHGRSGRDRSRERSRTRSRPGEP